MPYRQEISEVALPLEGGDIASVLQKFDKNSALCYKMNTSPLFLRDQDARRSCTASAFLTDRQAYLNKSRLGVS
jgi:hypothetical protein